ncbi:hypothetical protein ABZ816_36080 [Actinosynnema sp. NPDC047251]|uniref:Putative secreted protein n=1 Tax=Saccharothrix espanaensis (strain ATCC 51144 / DSM 44229 / JCM 9112 / NBRC 15066 / NRRL 15764) TaxID=1179773 RepID=K0JWE9_SACES|nr:hypothetical protein [Saccharothrix espanaensis]CCH29094.1 putative secreted protein [Saccharothrix espanaensis DSM 44229]
MRSLGTAIGAGALLLVLVGCASNQPALDAGNGGGPTLTTSPSNPPSSSEDPEFQSPVPPGGKEVPKAKLDASAVPEGTPQTVWTEGDGSTLGLIGQEGGCGKASVEIAEQTAQAVKVVLVETTPKDAEVCTMDIRHPPLTAKLEAPLGERSVVLSTRQDQK